MTGTSALIRVAQDTINLCRRDKDTTTVYGITEFQNCDSETVEKFPDVKVVNADYITLAYERAATHKVAILNMCSDVRPGGGFLDGTTAGEEELCRRSSLYHQLILHKNEYPFCGGKLLYSKAVTIFKDQSTYSRLKIERDVDVISVAALRKPRLNAARDGYLYSEDEAEMRARISAILNVAQQNNIKCLVLSAFGSGCFGNPPERVAAIFKSCITQFDFDEVVFGILDNRLRGKTTSNYEVYSRIFQ